MKLAHISDLHIGKNVNGFSMIEDQEFILKKIMDIVKEKSVHVLMICGDVFDKNVPSVEGIRLYDRFIDRLSSENINTFIISGNHDSIERLSCGSKLMRGSGIYISRNLGEDENRYILEDEFGEINIYMLPFIKPAHVRYAYDEQVLQYTEAVAAAISRMGVDRKKRNILMAHQYITGAARSESEEIFVGGLDNVSSRVFDDFDYVALGHLHKPQHVERKTIRYCGAPLKYSISEKNHNKSLTIIDFMEKGNIEIETVPLEPLRDICEIRGKYDELMSLNFYSTLDRENYFSIVLTDENDIADAVGRMRTVYPNIMGLSYDNRRTNTKSNADAAVISRAKNPCDYIDELFYAQNSSRLGSYQRELLEEIIAELEDI